MRIIIDLPDTGELEQLASEATTSARPARIALGHALQGAIVAALRRSGAPGHRIVTHLPPHTEHRRAELPADREAVLRQQVAGGMREMFGARAFYTLTAADVGRHTLRIFGRNVPASHFIGQVLPGDVGKRCYDVDGIVQVENEAQRAARVASSGRA